MTTEAMAMVQEELTRELQNFQEIIRYLKPSPTTIPRLQGIDIHGLSLPLRHGVGGDHILYIDFNKRFDLDVRIEDARRAGREKVARQLQCNRERAGIMVADVSGHQMTDALITAMLHQSFVLGAYYELEMFGEITTKIFEHINQGFYQTTSMSKYFTMIYGEISTQGRFRFISAGHPPPAVFSREYDRLMPIDEDRTVSFLPVAMLPSAGDRDERRHGSAHGHKKPYAVNEIELLAEGDILLLHTDGLAEHGGGSYFANELPRVLAACKDESASRICDRLRESLAGWAPQRDDISAVVVKFGRGARVSRRP